MSKIYSYILNIFNKAFNGVFVIQVKIKINEEVAQFP